MKKLKLDLDALDVRSFATQAAPEKRGTVLARGIADRQQEFTLPQTDFTIPLTITDTGTTSFTYPDTWGTGPCTTAPSSDFPCYTNDCQYAA